MDSLWSHFGQWWAVAVWIVFYGIFLAFLPFYKKSQVKPSGVYLAFVVAYALEMFGVPLSMFIIAWVFGHTLPDGVLWGHTLQPYIGLWGMWIGLVFSIIGALLVIFGWKEMHRRYWSKEEGKGQLVTNGMYAYVRHPQYTGFLLISLGMLCEWATVPLLIMWPILAVLYYRLAKKEEAEMEHEFNGAYVESRLHTSMFVPLPRLARTSASIHGGSLSPPRTITTSARIRAPGLATLDSRSDNRLRKNGIAVFPQARSCERAWAEFNLEFREFPS